MSQTGLEDGYLQLIKQNLGGAVPFVHLTGVELLEVAEGRATARLPDAPQLKNHLGTQHAAALFAAGETASGAALAGALGPLLLAVLPVVRTAQIRYAKPARGEIIAAAATDIAAEDLQARLNEGGRAETTVAVSFTDSSGAEVATMTVEWVVLKRRPRDGG